MDNLKKQGKPEENIFFVGNTMIDTMIAFAGNIDESDIVTKLNLEKQKYMLMTMHRPANVDTKDGLLQLLSLIQRITQKLKLVFPVHPRTAKNMKEFALHQKFPDNKNLLLTEPLNYFSFQKLIKESFCVITDSGGIQEETTFLQIPCLTLRANTERPVTLAMGTNELVPFDGSIIEKKISSIENGTYRQGAIPPLWDGKATERIVKILSEKL